MRRARAHEHIGQAGPCGDRCAWSRAAGRPPAEAGVAWGHGPLRSTTSRASPVSGSSPRCCSAWASTCAGESAHVSGEAPRDRDGLDAVSRPRVRCRLGSSRAGEARSRARPGGAGRLPARDVDVRRGTGWARRAPNVGSARPRHIAITGSISSRSRRTRCRPRRRVAAADSPAARYETWRRGRARIRR